MDKGDIRTFITKTFKLKQEDVDSDKREVAGMASTFGNKDLDGDIIEPTAFNEQFANGPLLNVKTLWQHSRFDPIGLGVATLMDSGIKFATTLAKNIPVADQAFESAKQGLVDSFSIGFNIPKGGINFDEDKNAWIISKAILREVSLVTFPANPLATISDVKSLEDVKEVRQSMTAFLLEAGYSHGIIKAAFSGNLHSLPGADTDKDAQDVIKSLKTTFNIT
jgi:HK97 family phage prohead protease